MSISFATVTPADFDIGPCKVTYNTVDLGGTLDNVVIHFKYDKAPLKADQTGTTLLDEAVSGMEVTVATSFLETRNKANLATILPAFTLAGTSPANFLTMNNKVATRYLAALAFPLELHPMSDATAVKNFDYYFYKDVPSEESEIILGPADQRRVKIIWKIYLDFTVTGGQMFRYGDHTL